MSKFISGKELTKRCGIKDFEIFDYLKQGLQPYDRHGKRVINTDSLKRARRYSIEEVEKNVRAKQHARVLGGPGATTPPKSEGEIKQVAQMIYKGQALEIVNSPEDCVLKSFTIPLDEKKARAHIEYFLNCQFKINDILEFEKKHNLKSTQEKKKDSGPPQRTEKYKSTVFPCKPGTTWEDVTITLVADDMVRIKTPSAQGRFTYHQLGMQDGRTGDRPTMVWGFLTLLAKHTGVIHSQNVNFDRTLPDTAKRLNKHLKKLFGIDESIYRAHYKTEGAYRTKIRFHDQTV